MNKNVSMAIEKAVEKITPKNGLSISENKLVKISYTWTNLSITANYRLFSNKMLARGTISLMDSRSKINSQLFGIRAGADYQIQNPYGRWL